MASSIPNPHLLATSLCCLSVIPCIQALKGRALVPGWVWERFVLLAAGRLRDAGKPEGKPQLLAMGRADGDGIPPPGSSAWKQHSVG